MKQRKILSLILVTCFLFHLTGVAAVNDEHDIGKGCDRIYLQSNGTVYAFDFAQGEYRVFNSREFYLNKEYIGLYEELRGNRRIVEFTEVEESAPSGGGIPTSRSGLKEYNSTAYFDMADEKEWDLIFDENADEDCPPATDYSLSTQSTQTPAPPYGIPSAIWKLAQVLMPLAAVITIYEFVKRTLSGK